jgi:alkylated DNA repair protein (DNA oxidative demethylase)
MDLSILKGMEKQLSLFEEQYPEGFAYYPDFLTKEEEQQLLNLFLGLKWDDFSMYGVTAKRKIIHFGVGYDFMARSMRPAPAPPEELNFLIAKVARILNIRSEDIKEILLTHYPKGSQIGWHFDAPAFEDLIGISIGNPALLKLREGRDSKKRVIKKVLEPGSCYTLRGEARWKWQHHIPPVENERFSITLRTIRA